MGFKPKQDPSSLETVNKFTKRMESTTEEAKSAIHKVQEDITRYYNQRRSLVSVFQPGDWVYLDTSDIKTTRPSPKLSHRRLGPFEIERQIGPLAYRLKLPHGLRQLHLVFNMVKLSAAVMPYKRLGKISDILHLNNENNQLERRARPPKDVPLDAQLWT